MSLAGDERGVGKYMVCSGGLELRHQIAPTIRARSRAAETSQARVSRVFRTEANGAVSAGTPLSATHFSSAPRSFTLCHLSSGSFARQRLMMRSSAGGDAGTNSVIGFGSADRIEAMRLALVFPVKGGLPVTIS